ELGLTGAAVSVIQAITLSFKSLARHSFVKGAMSSGLQSASSCLQSSRDSYPYVFATDHLGTLGAASAAAGYHMSRAAVHQGSPGGSSTALPIDPHDAGLGPPPPHGYPSPVTSAPGEVNGTTFPRSNNSSEVTCSCLVSDYEWQEWLPRPIRSGRSGCLVRLGVAVVWRRSAQAKNVATQLTAAANVTNDDEEAIKTRVLVASETSPC
ncbi:unnamed protein product, partial [Cyprideis torosa]